MIDFRQPSPFLHPRTMRATVVVLLALLAPLLQFPRLRHAAGQVLDARRSIVRHF